MRLMGLHWADEIPPGALAMPHVPVLLPGDASQEVKNLYEDFRRRMQFPAAPNFIMTQGHSGAVARGTWDLVRNVLVGGEIPRWNKEMIFAAISKDRNCGYCAAAHLACCRMLGVNPGTLESMVRNVDSIPDDKLRDMIQFAIRCSRDPRGLVEADFDKLRRHGIKQSQIMELIAMSALAVYANIVADATAMDADAMFGTL
jgi:uncharacterized peroxidase-related enzyme